MFGRELKPGFIFEKVSQDVDRPKVDTMQYDAKSTRRNVDATQLRHDQTSSFIDLY